MIVLSLFGASTNELDKVVYNNRLSVTSLFDGNGSLAKETFTKLGKTDKEIVYTWDNQNRLSQITYQYTNRPVFMPTVPDNMQDWKGMDGAIAFHLIERHADNWSDTGKMMGEWLAANQGSQPVRE